MIRYDQVDKKTDDVVEEEQTLSRKQVKIDEVMMRKISEIFLNQLKVIEINGVLLISNINKKTIIINSDITLQMLSDALKKPLESKEEFIKEYYMYMLDKITDEAYDEPVTAIQEYPYSFQASDNENIINYEFILS